VDLPAAAEAILRRNRGIQAAKDIRECKEDTLDLSERDLGDEGAIELVEELKVWVCSRALGWSFFCCAWLLALLLVRLSVTHVTSAILVLQENTALKELNLYGNKIGDDGGKAIGKALEVSFVLVSSFVFLCGYPPHLSASVTTTSATRHTQVNKTLQTLPINGAIPIAKLRGDEMCTELSLQRSGYKDPDAIVIAALLAVRALLFFSYSPVRLPSSR
jgi:hypothetical protein